MFPRQKNNFSGLIKPIFVIIAVVLVFATPVRRWMNTGIAVITNYLQPGQVELSESREKLMLMNILLNLENENSILRSQLAGLDINDKIIPAKVSIGGGYLFSDVLLLDRGRNHNVEIGDFAVSDTSMILGEVIEIGTNWSRVVLFTRVGQQTMLRGGIAKSVVFEGLGVGGGEIRAELPANLGIQVGDVLWWGGDPDYAVGLVDRIDKAEGRKLQSITIRRSIPAKSIVDVSIVAGGYE